MQHELPNHAKGLLAAISVALLLALSLLSALSPVASASSALVQENSDGCAITGCSIPAIALPNPVTTGDVIVVLVAAYSGTVTSVTDSLGSTYVLAASVASGPVTTYAYYATLASSATDSVTVALSSVNIQAGAYVYEVSGVTTTGEANSTGTGTCSSYPCSPTTSTSVAAPSGAFLVSMAGTPSTGTSAAGPGFTFTPGSGLATFGGYSEYSASGVTSPTNFPFVVASGSVYWGEVGIVLPPSGGSTTTTTTSTSTSTTTTSTTTTSTTTTTSPPARTCPPCSVGYTLLDGVSVQDRQSPTVFPLIKQTLDDTLSVSDSTLHTISQLIKKTLSDAAGLFDTPGSQTNPSAVSGLLIFAVHSPANILVISPAGMEAGFLANGTEVNQLGANLTGPNTEPESVSILNPLSGVYQVEVFGKSTASAGGSSFTVTAAKSGASGSATGSWTYTGTTAPGSQQDLEVRLGSGGSVSDALAQSPSALWLAAIASVVAIGSLAVLLLPGEKSLPSRMKRVS